MRAGSILARRGPLFGLLAMGVALLAVGCKPDPYPESMTYPVRSDLLVVAMPGSNPPGPEPLGTFEQSIRALAAESGNLTRNPADLTPEVRDELAYSLERVYGTPRNPAVDIADAETLQMLKIDPFTLQSGSVLYRRHCLHCHGVAGDGRGPTAAWVNPHPRDYRRGLFKFVSTKSGQRPTRQDLYRTLYEGIEGTSMPSFKTLPPDELDQLVSYVIHLSMRGEAEFIALQQILPDRPGGELSPDAMSILKSLRSRKEGSDGQFVVRGWANPELIDVLPYTPPEGDEEMKKSVRAGYELFVSDDEGGCVKCHKDFGRQAQWYFDAWGTRVRPANLTMGTFRGGRRPVDIYYRVASGIAPSQMPATSTKVVDPAVPQKAWNLVNFVRALPYPQMLPDDVRDKIYGQDYGEAPKKP